MDRRFRPRSWFTASISIACSILASLSAICATSTSALARDDLDSRPSQGELANESGRSLEDRIADVLIGAGFDVMRAADYRESMLYRSEHPRIAVREAPYDSIYGRGPHIEFRVIDAERQILIEAKRQTVAGSVDEKLPFVFENAKLNIAHGLGFALVMEGDGFREGAVSWIRARAAETDGFDVFTPEEFELWVAHDLAASPAGRPSPR